MTKCIEKINGVNYPLYRIDNDSNGNPRYLIHFLDLDLKDHVSTKATRKAGLKKYTGKSFGGGFVFQSYNVESSLRYILKTLKEEQE